jgi:5-methylcytosine-specific restriction enzyme subunit McrC
MAPTDPPRTYRFRERVPAVCRLTPADVQYLQAEHHAHLELLPTFRRGRYRLTSRGRVGLIAAPQCRIIIQPKIPLDNLFHLLDPVQPLSLITDHAQVTPGVEALHFLADCLARLLSERSAAGLHRGYVEQTEQGCFLHGSLDVSAQLRQPSANRDVIHSRHEAFTADLPCNQVPKATAELLLRYPLGGAVRAALASALQGFAEVTSKEPLSIPGVEFDRPTEAYRPLLELCWLVLQGLTPGQNAGRVPCPAFLLDMERVFERYITTGVLQAFAKGPYDVAVQRSLVANQPCAGQPDLTMKPDLVISLDGKPVLVVDAKWKDLEGSPLVTADLYQMLAYCTALGVRRAVLVYPGRRQRVWRYVLPESAVLLEIRTLRIRGPRETCVLALEKLGRALRRPHVSAR